MKYNAVYIEITNICNLQCSFCIGTKRPPRFMSVEDFETVARKARLVTDYLYLHLMGEPLLHPQLGEILQVANRLGFQVNLTTNGTLLSRQKEILLSSPCLRKVAVSLHSFEGNESTCSLTEYLEGVWQFCEAFSGLVELRLWNEGGRNARNAEIIAFLSQKTGQDVASLPQVNRSKRLAENRFLVSADQFDWPSLSAEKTTVRTCYGLKTHFGILCDGTVVPCCLDSEGTIALGNALQEDLLSVLSSERAKNMAEGFRNMCPSEELCKHCGYATRFVR